MYRYQPVSGTSPVKRLNKSVHKRMLVEQDLQLCSTLVSRALACLSALAALNYTLIHSAVL